MAGFTAGRSFLPLLAMLGLFVPSPALHQSRGEDSIQQGWGSGSICMRVLAFDRPESMMRLLNQLTELEYGRDSGSIHLVVHVDYPEQGSDPTVLHNRALSVEAARHFQWIHGKKEVVAHDQHQGIVNMWANSWIPEQDSSDACIILEDDLVPSKYAWTWTRNAFDAYGHSQEIASFALQKQHTVPVPVKYQKCEFPPASGEPFLYKLMATWGLVALREPWQKFRTWISMHTLQCPELQHDGHELLPTTWCKEKPGAVWSVYFIKFMEENKLFTLYPNIQGEETLCTNMREPGLHFSGDKGPDAPVLEVPTAALQEFPPLDTLPRYDWDGSMITQNAESR